ncbi:MAG: hypothetical protein K2M46_07190 [Lachnospiraceae bacterium]|nr:hypothetical protein [Lachnospiraceae bacterium]
MPRNQFQRMVFAFLTVIVTVHAYVFYSLYVVNGSTLMELNGTTSVLSAIHQQGGVYMLGRYVPIYVIVIVEFILAYCLEVVMGSPCSFKLACKIFDPRKNHPMIFESAIICATVGLMCPAMSFLAAILYYPYYAGFDIISLLANWLKLVCLNFPFAFFTQLFFIQPLIRTLFKLLFRRDIQKRAELEEQMRKENTKPKDEIGAIDNLMKRIDEIRAELEQEQQNLS